MGQRPSCCIASNAQTSACQPARPIWGGDTGGVTYKNDTGGVTAKNDTGGVITVQRADKRAPAGAPHLGGEYRRGNS